MYRIMGDFCGKIFCESILKWNFEIFFVIWSLMVCHVYGMLIFMKKNLKKSKNLQNSQNIFGANLPLYGIPLTYSTNCDTNPAHHTHQCCVLNSRFWCSLQGIPCKNFSTKKGQISHHMSSA